MPTQLQFRRGTTAQNNSFTGVVGEISIDTDTDNIRVHDGSEAGGFEVLPSGVILPFGGSTVPGNFLLCDGSNVSRTTYARLFAVISTAYGTGDGSTTFGLPDLRDRVPLGKGTNNSTLGTETGSAAASSVVNSTASNTGTGTTGTGTTGTGTSGDSSGVETSANNTGTGTTGTGTTGTGTTGSGTTGTGTTGGTSVTLSKSNGTFATSAKDSSTGTAMTNVNTSSHTHSIPGLSVPGLSIPGLSVPGLSVPALTIPALSVDDHSHSIPGLSIPGLSVPALTIPALSTTLPTSVVNYIIKT